MVIWGENTLSPHPRIRYEGRNQNRDSAHFDAHFFKIPFFTGIRSKVCEWCTENLGPRIEESFYLNKFRSELPDHRPGRWYKHGGVVVIYDDDDALAFRLRWC